MLSIFSILSIFSDEIFLILGQSPPICLQLKTYVIHTIPGLFFTSFFDLRAVYFNSQEIFLAPVIIQTLTTLTHYFWCILLFDYHIEGIAWAMNISLFLSFFFLEMYNIFLSQRKAAHTEWSIEVFKNFFEYIRVTVPIGLTTVLEEFSYEINSLIAGTLQPESILAAHVSLANVGALLYCLPEGFAVGINTYVGIALGEGKVHKAKRNAILGYMGAVATMVISYSLLYFFEDQWATLLIDHSEVIELIKKIFYLFALVGLIDTVPVSFGSCR